MNNNNIEKPLKHTLDCFLLHTVKN